MRKLGLALILLLSAGRLYEAPTAPLPPSKPVAKPTPHTDHQCIASALYHEARGEPLEGQKAVYEVIMHRVKAHRMSPCAVVKAPKQFSWYGEKPILPFTKPMQDLLKRVKNHPPVLDGPKFRWFFSGEIFPKWAERMECRVIGAHRFCKEEDKNNNASDREVRHPSEGAEEDAERRERRDLRDVRNRVPEADPRGTQYAQGQESE